MRFDNLFELHGIKVAELKLLIKNGKRLVAKALVMQHKVAFLRKQNNRRACTMQPIANNGVV